MNVVSASELLAAAEASGAGGGQPIAYKHDDLAYDMGLLAAFDNHPLDPAAWAADKEGALARAAVDATQLLVRRVWELPVEKTDVGPVALLPPRSTRLPRTQPPPAPKPLTRWQKFAKEKGIEKKKRSRLVFDEPTGEWKPRWGKERAKDGTADWLIPVKQAPGKKRARDDGVPDPMDEGEDEFSKRDLAKKDRVLKNSLSQLKNIQRATKRGGASSSAASAALASLTGGGGGGGDGRSAGKKARRSGGGDDDEPVVAHGGKRVFTFEGGGGAARATDSAAALVAPRVRSVDVVPKSKAALGDRSGKKVKAGGKKGVSFAPSTTGGGGGSGLPVGLPPIAGASSGEGRVDTPFGAGKAMGKRSLVKEGRDVKAARLKLAQSSTASMGRFDRVLAGEPARPKDKRLTKRLSSTLPASTEKSRNSSILKSVLGGSGEGERAAAGGVALPGRDKRMRAADGGGDDRGKGKGKGGGFKGGFKGGKRRADGPPGGGGGGGGFKGGKKGRR